MKLACFQTWDVPEWPELWPNRVIDDCLPYSALLFAACRFGTAKTFRAGSFFLQKRVIVRETRARGRLLAASCPWRSARLETQPYSSPANRNAARYWSRSLSDLKGISVASHFSDKPGCTRSRALRDAAASSRCWVIAAEAVSTRWAPTKSARRRSDSRDKLIASS